jgi:hypothetical protein
MRWSPPPGRKKRREEKRREEKRDDRDAERSGLCAWLGCLNNLRLFSIPLHGQKEDLG